jgi:hypothetical protein
MSNLYPISKVELLKLWTLVDDRTKALEAKGDYKPLNDEEITTLVEQATGRKAWSPKEVWQLRPKEGGAK